MNSNDNKHSTPPREMRLDEFFALAPQRKLSIYDNRSISTAQSGEELARHHLLMQQRRAIHHAEQRLGVPLVWYSSCRTFQVEPKSQPEHDEDDYVRIYEEFTEGVLVDDDVSIGNETTRTDNRSTRSNMSNNSNNQEDKDTYMTLMKHPGMTRRDNLRHPASYTQQQKIQWDDGSKHHVFPGNGEKHPPVYDNKTKSKVRTSAPEKGVSTSRMRTSR